MKKCRQCGRKSKTDFCTPACLLSNQNKMLREQVSAFEDWLINWYSADFSKKKTRSQIQAELKRRMMNNQPTPSPAAKPGDI